ncbi:MAG: FtsX-like permease family protein [Gammaproteobacteria bacterium]|nr:FtsX-like permease family protein [Gammaproteobacteria bacterium]
MLALNRKLWRDLNNLRGQVLAVGLVIASGVGVLVMSLSVHESLSVTAEAYYDRYRFADVFAGSKRTPEWVARRIADIPGVQSVQTRIVHMATLDIPGFAEPVIGQLVSIPEDGQPQLNRLALRAGRWVQAGHPDEVIISEPFAEAHDLGPGDSFDAIINGNKRALSIVGIGLGPEFVYAIGPGALMPDEARFGVVWMGRKALEAAYDLKGAFNDVSLSLLRGTNETNVIDRLDQLLERYGGFGAFARADQLSNWFLMNEIAQIETLSGILPTIFLAVAAFLTQMVLARLIAIQRSEIGLLKAFGYSDFEIGWHFIKLVIAMTAVGIVMGWGVGAWLGRTTTELYATLYRFPLLIFQPSASVFAIGAIVSLGAALAGTFGAVRRAARLPPAEAMRPPEPPAYQKSRFLDGPLGRWFDQPTRILFRQIGRWPGRSAVTSLGVGMAIGVLIMAMQWMDSIDHLAQVYFFDAQRQDLMVGLVEPEASRARHDFAQLPGVLSVEGTRIVGARLHAGNRSHRGGIQGVRPTDTLQPIYDASGGVVDVPPEGLVLGTKLAEKLDVGIGDQVQVEVLSGRRPEAVLPVTGLVETYIGVPAFMNTDALDRLMRERPSLEYANLVIDENRQDELFAALKDTPRVVAVMLRSAAVETFYKTMAETLTVYVSFFAAFAVALGFGVVYNSARIALSERGRDLATLRVLGFTRREIAYILLGEVGLLIFLALPLGAIIGKLLALMMTSVFETELFRIPPVVEPSTYGISILTVMISAAVSGWLIRRRLNRLDLIGVLKTRE